MRTKALAIPLLVLTLLASACGGIGGNGSGSGGGSGPTGSSGAIAHPTGPNDLVLRISTAGGFLAPQALLKQFPEFSLFGDGRAITTGAQIDIYPGPALPSLQVTQLSEADVQAILRAADAAGLLGRDADYPYPCVSDLPTTTFTVDANGSTHTVTAYALGIDASPGASASGATGGASGGSGVVGSSGSSSPTGSSGLSSGSGGSFTTGASGAAGTSGSRSTGASGAGSSGAIGVPGGVGGASGGCGSNTEARARLSAFAAKVTDLGSWLPDAPGMSEPYTPTEMRIYVSPYQGQQQLRQRPVAWPLAQPLRSFGSADANLSDLACGVVAGDDLAALLPLAQGANELTPWTSDGKRYGLVFRPLLPDEHGC